MGQQREFTQRTAVSEAATHNNQIRRQRTAGRGVRGSNTKAAVSLKEYSKVQISPSYKGENSPGVKGEDARKRCDNAGKECAGGGGISLLKHNENCTHPNERMHSRELESVVHISMNGSRPRDECLGQMNACSSSYRA